MAQLRLTDHDPHPQGDNVHDQPDANDSRETTALLHPVDKQRKTWFPERLKQNRWLAIGIGAVVFAVAAVLAVLGAIGLMTADENASPKDGVSCFLRTHQ